MRIESISPSKYERLRACALQVFLESEHEGGERRIRVSKPQLIGFVFHKAFQIFLTDPAVTVFDAWHLASSQISKEYLTQIDEASIRQPQLFFERRVHELRTLLASLGAERGTELIKAEFSCSTQDDSIKGVIDLFVDVEKPIVIDFKTGIDAELKTISPKIARQLAVYSGIVSDIRGVSPRVFVMGMKSGLREVTEIEVEPVMEEVRFLVREFNSGRRTNQSNVSVDSCSFCRQIGNCRDLWNDTYIAQQLGCLMGNVMTVMVANNKKAYVQLVMQDGSVASIRDVPNEKVDGVLSRARLKFWGLKAVSEGLNAFSWLPSRSHLVVENG